MKALFGSSHYRGKSTNSLLSIILQNYEYPSVIAPKETALWPMHMLIHRPSYRAGSHHPDRPRPGNSGPRHWQSLWEM